MKRVILCATLILVVVAVNEARSQTGADDPIPYGLEPGALSIGFQLLEDLDHSRAVTGGISNSLVHPRPIRTYLWYPARQSDDAQTMRFAHYAALADDDIWPVEIAGDLRDELKYARRAEDYSFHSWPARWCDFPVRGLR